MSGELNKILHCQTTCLPGTLMIMTTNSRSMRKIGSNADTGVSGLKHYGGAPPRPIGALVIYLFYTEDDEHRSTN